MTAVLEAVALVQRVAFVRTDCVFLHVLQRVAQLFVEMMVAEVCAEFVVSGLHVCKEFALLRALLSAA